MKRIVHLGAALCLSAIAMFAICLSGQELQGPNTGSSFKLPAIGSQGKSKTGGSVQMKESLHQEYRCMRAMAESKIIDLDFNRVTTSGTSYEAFVYGSDDVVFPFRSGSQLKLLFLGDDRFKTLEIKKPAVEGNGPYREYTVDTSFGGTAVGLNIYENKEDPNVVIIGAGSRSGTPQMPKKAIESYDEIRRIVHDRIRFSLPTIGEAFRLKKNAMMNPGGLSASARAQNATEQKNGYDFMANQLKKTVCYCGSIPQLEDEIKKLKEDPNVKEIIEDLSCDLS